VVDKNEIIRILDTYELTPALREIIAERAFKRLGKFSDFDDAYEYVDDSVQFFADYYTNRKLVTLDDGPLKGSFEFVGFNEKNTFDIDENFRQRKLKSTNESLEGLINKKNIDFLNKLLAQTSIENDEYKGMLTSLSVDELDRINDNLDLIRINLYEKHPYIIERGGLEIKSFNPFSIRFSNRRYQKDPLDFFNQHKQVYGGMSRKELESFDMGLARRLYIYDQMDDAIPEKKPHGLFLKDDKVKQIITSYDEFYGCPRKAEKPIGVRRETIKKYWLDAGLTIYASPFVFKDDPTIFIKRNNLEGLSRSQIKTQYPGSLMFCQRKIF
jgi:hypothetical protein